MREEKLGFLDEDESDRGWEQMEAVKEHGWSG